ncbi:MAG: penicillin-binding protein [Myxococcota bacterium]
MSADRMTDKHDKIVLPPLEPAIEPADRVRTRAQSRIRGVATMLIALLTVVGGRGAALCLFPAPRTLQAAAAQRWDQVTLRARRGEILDRDGRRLATSVATPNIAVDPYLVEAGEVDALAAKVADITGAPFDEVADRMRRKSRYQRIAVRVHPSVARKIEALDHPALWVEREPRRYYPEETLAAQVIGFVDAASTGREGLEASLDHWLRGESVLLQRRRDRHGTSLDDSTGDAGINEGLTVHLTLDRTIQRITEQALDEIVVHSAPLSATAVVIDVKTGDVLALANVPTFNPNDLASDAAPRRNHAVQDAIEPGSVMKPFTVAAAVEYGRVTPDTLVDCEGGSWVVGRSRIRDTHAHGAITIREVLKVSSNIGSAKLALDLGAERLLGMFNAFGFGLRTGVLLPGERTGVLRSPEHIRPIELATTAYGQGVTATPLQLAYALGALANGGVRMRPRLVTRVDDGSGIPDFVQPPAPVGRAVSEATARSVLTMMEGVTEDGGTAIRARVPGYRVAGKTGTAQKVENGRYGAGRIGSFVGVVPADDPVLSIVVTVDEPTIGSRYGGVIAAPAFAEIAAASLRHLGVPPDPALLHEPDEPETPELGPDGAPVVAAGPSPSVPVAVAVAPVPAARVPVRVAADSDGWTVPDLVGRSLREVVASIGPTGLALNLTGSGAVVSQQPAPGHTLPPGGELSLVLR